MKRSLGVILLCVLSGCLSSLTPPVSTAPPPSPSEDSAWVVFLSEPMEPFVSFRAERRGARIHTVRDESGEILGRLRGRSWFAVERPPGPQWFFSGDYTVHRVWDEQATTIVGALLADLEPGKMYFVRVDFLEGARRGIRERVREHRESPCLMPDDDLDQKPRFADLVGLRPDGAEWSRALDVLRRGVRYQSAPRGLGEPDENNIVARGRARLGRCLDLERSRLGPEHGLTAWPLPTPLVAERASTVEVETAPAPEGATCPRTRVADCPDATRTLTALVEAQCLAKDEDTHTSDDDVVVEVVEGSCGLPNAKGLGLEVC